jgi:hypothetical protein
MAAQFETILGVSSRRSACDRCRHLKLACVRSSSVKENCDRCVRAHANCVTSSIFRMRAYRPGDAEQPKVVDRVRGGCDRLRQQPPELTATAQSSGVLRPTCTAVEDVDSSSDASTWESSLFLPFPTNVSHSTQNPPSSPWTKEGSGNKENQELIR